MVALRRANKFDGSSFACVLKSSALTNSNCDCGWNVRSKIVGGTSAGVNEFVSHAGLVDKTTKEIFCGAIIGECLLKCFNSSLEIKILVKIFQSLKPTQSPLLIASTLIQTLHPQLCLLAITIYQRGQTRYGLLRIFFNLTQNIASTTLKPTQTILQQSEFVTTLSSSKLVFIIKFLIRSQNLILIY